MLGCSTDCYRAGRTPWEAEAQAYDELLKPMREEIAHLAFWAIDRRILCLRGLTLREGGSIAARGANPRNAMSSRTPAERAREGHGFSATCRLPARMFLFTGWYNRAGVEQVMGFCSEVEAKTFLDAVPGFEKALADDGILIFKYWLCCDQEKQEERFAERLDDPLKRWKLSPIDIAARAKYGDYTQAREAMLKATHTEWAPWTLVDFNDQKLGRLLTCCDLLRSAAGQEAPAPVIEFPRSTGGRRRSGSGC